MPERFECSRAHCGWTGTHQERKNNETGSWHASLCPHCYGGMFRTIEAPQENERINHVNELIKAISEHGEKQFCSRGVTAHMEIDKNGIVWFIDDYSRRRIYTHYHGSWRGFSHGGTLRELVCAMRDYVKKGHKIPLSWIAPVSVDDDDNKLGYSQEPAQALRKIIIKLPVISE